MSSLSCARFSIDSRHLDTLLVILAHPAYSFGALALFLNINISSVLCSSKPLVQSSVQRTPPDVRLFSPEPLSLVPYIANVRIDIEASQKRWKPETRKSPRSISRIEGHASTYKHREY